MTLVVLRYERVCAVGGTCLALKPLPASWICLACPAGMDEGGRGRREIGRLRREFATATRPRQANERDVVVVWCL